MDDMERQIRAWADAAASASSVEAVTADEARAWSTEAEVPPPVDAAGRNRRWLAIAAVVAVLAAGAAAAIGVVGDGDDTEPVRTGEPEAPTTGEPDPLADRGPTAEVTFDVLHIGLAGEEPAGVIRSARTDEQLAELWDDLVPLEEWTGEEPTPIGPPPSIDFDAQAVVSLTIPDDACPPTLDSFQRSDGWITPIFVQPAGGCDEPYVPKRYVVAIDWAPFAGSMGIELFADGFPGIEDASLLLRPNRTEQVIVDLGLSEDVEASGEVAAGGEVRGSVVINNGTGEPIDITYCGAEFAGGLRSDDAETTLAFNHCLTSGQIPPGLSWFPVEILTTYGTCVSGGTVLPGQATCGPGGAIPPLPPGEYEVVLENPGGLDAEAPPVTITLT